MVYCVMNLVMRNIETVWLKQMNCMKPLQKFFSSNDMISVVHEHTYLVLTVANLTIVSHLLWSITNTKDVVLLCDRIGNLDSSFHLLVVTEIAWVHFLKKKKGPVSRNERKERHLELVGAIMLHCTNCHISGHNVTQI